MILSPDSPAAMRAVVAATPRFIPTAAKYSEGTALRLYMNQLQKHHGICEKGGRDGCVF